MNLNYPKYEPTRWNTNKFICKSHNCYMYALNIISKSYIEKCKKDFSKKTKCRRLLPISKTKNIL